MWIAGFGWSSACAYTIMVEEFSSKKLLFIGIAAAVVLIAGVIWYWSQKEDGVPKDEGAVETAKTVSESVPEIQTNPGEKVPEVNPLDRANPFKYNNPLR